MFELSNAQAKVVIDSEQAFTALRDAQKQARAVRGGMHWKSLPARSISTAR